MSGIVGFWNPDGRPAAAGEIARMIDAISHRGPDGNSRIVDGPVALGYLHLEIRTGPLPVVQPFADIESGAVIVLDGRIDNREELRSSLESFGFASADASDAELVLRAYLAWGTGSPTRLLGDFAFAIWDSRNQRFFCARDQLGVKPFIYHYSRNRVFSFCSEIQGIIGLDRVPRRLNECRLADYLVAELDRVDTVGTFYEEIHRLPGGHCLIASRDSTTVWNYWTLTPREERYRSMRECSDALRSILMRAVSDRTGGADRVGYAISGGLDSSSVVATARELSGGPAHANVTTFSVVDPASPQPIQMIKSVVDQGGVTSRTLLPEDVTVENLDLASLVRKSDQPFEANQSCFHWFIYRAAHRSGCRMFVDGLDGDQMTPHELYLSALLRRGSWSHAMKNASSLARASKAAAWRMLVANGFLPLVPRIDCTLAAIKHAIRKPSQPVWIGAELARRTRVAERIRDRRLRMTRAARDAFELHALSFTSGHVSFSLEGSDKLGGLLAVEPCHPFSDRRLAEFMLALPIEIKGHSPLPKMLLRTAMRGLLPDTLLRQSRLPHPGPAIHARVLECHAEWLNAYVELCLRRLQDYVNTDTIRALYRSYRLERDDEAREPLWSVAILTDWMTARGFC